MLRRSVPFRMLAVALAGISLGACSSGSEDATAPSPDPSMAVNPLHFSLSTSNLYFDFSGLTAPAPQTVEVSGLVVTTTPYVRVLSTNYSPSNLKDWVRITQRPGLLSDGTLGVRLTFTPRYVAGVETGASAIIPVTVPGARNGPQTINVFTNLLNCQVQSQIPYPTPIGAMSYVVGNLLLSDCSSPLIGGKPFDLYSLQVPANRNFRLDNRASGSGGGTLSDAYIYVYDPMTGTIIAADDDGGSGLDSRLYMTNSSASPKLYYLLASDYCCGQTGSYTFEVTDLGPATSPPFQIAPEPETPAELAKKRGTRQ